MVEVGGVAVAAARVLHLVRRPGDGGADGDVADEDAGAGAGLDSLPRGDHRAAGGIGEHVQAARGAVGPGGGDDGLPAEPGHVVAGPDNQARGSFEGGAGLGGQRGGLGLRCGHLRRGLHTGQGSPRSAVHARGHTTRAPVHDEVTAQHRKAAQGTLEAQVTAAVGVRDDVLDDKLLLRAEAQGPGDHRALTGGVGESLVAAGLALPGDGRGRG